jgi:hypothetical protein
VAYSSAVSQFCKTDFQQGTPPSSISSHTPDSVIPPNGADFAPEFLYFKAFGDDAGLQAQFEAWGYKAEQAA